MVFGTTDGAATRSANTVAFLHVPSKCLDCLIPKKKIILTFSVDFLATSRYNPGALQTRKWEDALTIDKSSWGWNRNATISDYMSVKEVVDMLVETVAFNGNVLLNVGPGADGTLAPIFVDRLLGIGASDLVAAHRTSSKTRELKIQWLCICCVSFYHIRAHRRMAQSQR